MDKIPFISWVLALLFLAGVVIGFLLQYNQPPMEDLVPSFSSHGGKYGVTVYEAYIRDIVTPRFKEGRVVSIIMAEEARYEMDGPVHFTKPRAWHYGEQRTTYMEGKEGEAELKSGVMEFDSLRIWGDLKMEVKEKGNGLHDRGEAEQGKEGRLVLEPESEKRQGSGDQ